VDDAGANVDDAGANMLDAGRTMLEETAGVREEAERLFLLVTDFDEASWWRPTPFKGWSPFDVLVHLHMTDRAGLRAIREPEAFRREAKERVETLVTTQPILPRERIELRDPAQLVREWRERLEELCAALDALDPKARLAWFGPDMGVRTFAAARLMEVWAHAQDIYDLLRRPRVHSDCIRPIAELGVRTFGWTFANRGLEPPVVKPHLRLAAPSGAVWEWNDPASPERIEGSAVEFCQVVTQGRNIADTTLLVSGEAATRWMSIAQCFAGAPKDPPARGERAW